jgi:starvation-inducible DNA-binding protein
MPGIRGFPAFAAEEVPCSREVAVRPTHRFDAADVGYTLTTTEQWPRGEDRGSEEFFRSGPGDRPEEMRIFIGNWLNRILADCQVLSALSQKYHRLTRATDPYLCTVLARHADQQLALANEVAERLHVVGGVAAADPRHIGELTCVPRGPDGAESVPSAVSRLLQAHDIALRCARAGALVLRERGDQVSADLVDLQVVATAEAQMQELIA